MKYFIILTICLSFFSCKKGKYKIKDNSIKINSELLNENNLNPSEYFDSLHFVILDANKYSFFKYINRMILFKNRIFIFDIATKSVIIFNNEGKYINRIKSLGKGPKEYVQLSDICIDEINQYLIIYADIPYKLLFFDLNGNYIKEQKLNKLYNCFSMVKNNYIFFNNFSNIKRSFYLWKINNTNFQEEGFLPYDKLTKNLVFSNYQNLIKSKGLYFFNAFDFKVYQININNIEYKYDIEMGKQQISKAEIEERENIQELNMYCHKNKLYHSIIGFRETSEYIYFGLNPGSDMILYSKIKHTARKFKFVYDEENKITLGNYIPHDGVDDNIIFSGKSDFFKKKYIINNKKTINQEFKKLKNIVDTLKNNSQILFIYHFKKL